MADFPIDVNDGSVQITAVGGETELDFDFPIYAAAHLKIVRTRAGTQTELALTTDYTIAADQLAVEAGGVAVLLVAATAADIYTLLLNVPAERTTDFQQAGDFTAAALNRELDLMTQTQQTFKRDLDKSLRLRDDEAFNATYWGRVPSRTDRASKVLGFDSNGLPIAATGIASAVSTFVATLIDDTTASAFMTTLGISAFAQTFLDDAASSNARSTLGLVIGTDVQAYDAQLASLAALSSVANLEALAGLTGAADLIAYFTAAGTMATRTAPANENLVYNARGKVALENVTTFTSATTPANSDDTYLLEGHILLSDGNDIVDVSKNVTASEAGWTYDIETANKKFAHLHILTAETSKAIIGGTASLSFKAKKGGSNATAENLRAALISWSGTADSVTSDVVSAWNVAGTNPTLVANWTYENTPSANHLLTTSYQTFKIENVSIDTASTKNVAVLIWLDDADATVADFIYIDEIKVERGAICTPFVDVKFEEDVAICSQFFEMKLANGATSYLGFGYSVSTTEANGGLDFSRKRIAPAVTFSGTVSAFVYANATSGYAASAIAAEIIQQNCLKLNLTTSGIAAGNLPGNLNMTNGAWIKLNSRL